MAAVIVDTHAALWMLLDSARLSIPARAALQTAVQAGAPIYVSPISLVEVVYLVDKRRLPEVAFQRLQEAIRGPSFVLTVAPLDHNIADAVRIVPIGEVPDMPDRIIAATALLMKLPLVTRDRKITASAIQTIW